VGLDMKQLRAELRALRESRVEEEDELEQEGGQLDEETDGFKAPLPAAKKELSWEVSGLQCVRFCFGELRFGALLGLTMGVLAVEDPNRMEEEGALTFGPGFAHQVFGAGEKVEGYRGLRIQQYYAPGSLYSFTRITFDERREKPAPSHPDLWATLKEWHPDAEVWLTECGEHFSHGMQEEDERAWCAGSLAQLQDHIALRECACFLQDLFSTGRSGEASWRPPGAKVLEYQHDGSVFEVQR
jgi:hypothetical protein